MTTAGVSSTTLSGNTQSTLQTLQENLSKPEKWLYLVPTIGALALGAFFIPNFAIGMAAGAGIFGAASVIAPALEALGIVKKEETPSEYAKFDQEWPILTTLGFPVFEEALFRGGVMPVIARCVVLIIPATAAAFLGTPLSIAMTVSIVATAAIFGLLHLFNPHPNAHLQAVAATISAIVLGLLAAQFGIGAAIAAHILNNTLVVTITQLFRQKHPVPTSQTAPATV